MITWDQNAVERFLGLAPVRRDSTTPIGTHSEFVFALPTPGGPVHFIVRPSLDHCQFVAADDNEFLSAYVQCARIVINDEPEEDGGQCLVLQGTAGHACVTPGSPHFKLFFSMHGRDTTRP
ncbi:MAG TPA: hypothetical protein VEA69_05575 [Tepidisphaeraceae bacterium]|nr:hypothetical protein [Tepidisphaeraceae bacterium]